MRSMSAASSRISPSVGAIVTMAVTRNATMLMPRISGSKNAVALAPVPIAAIPPPTTGRTLSAAMPV
jgi:hypothetical protein